MPCRSRSFPSSPLVSRTVRRWMLAAITLALACVTAGGNALASDPCPAPYPHPARAALVQASLVQAFISCSLYGYPSPNSTTEGLPSCFPGETFHQRAGSPPQGWLWGPHARGSVTFKAGKNNIAVGENNIHNPDGSVDLFITLKVSDIHDNTGVADGTNGNAQSVARATLIDRAHNQLVTVIDFPTGFGAPVSGGKINKKTSATVLLNHLQQPALPPCTTIELITFRVKDPNGSTFATLGAYLP